MTLDDLGLKGQYPLCFKTHASFGAHYENLNEDRPIISATKMWSNDSSFWQCKVYADIRGAIPWRGSVNDSGVIENVDFQEYFRRRVFGTLGNKANFIIRHYIVLCRLSTGPKIRDLDWLFEVQFSIFTITNRVSVIRLHIYRTSIYRIFLLYDVISRDVRKRIVIRRVLRIRERIADLSKTKSCGRHIVGTLTNKANIII